MMFCDTQEIAQTFGAEVGAHTHREYGFARVTVKKTGNELADRLFNGLECEDEGGMQVSSGETRKLRR